MNKDMDDKHIDLFPPRKRHPRLRVNPFPERLRIAALQVCAKLHKFIQKSR
jgi:hypothetical protein